MKAEQLKAAILQWAVEGKLVPQLDEDPAVEQIGEKPEEVPFAIPEKWKWVSLEACVIFNPRASVANDDLKVTFLPMAAVTGGYVNKIDCSQERKWKSVKNGFSKFSNNDVILAKITPCFQNRKSAIIKNLPSGIGCGSTEFHVMRCKEFILPEYLLWLLKSSFFIHYGVDHFKGTAGQQRIGTRDLKLFPFPIPPLAEQRRIVARLNELLPLVDAYGTEQEALEELEKSLPDQLRASLLQEAVQGKLVPQLDDEPAVEQIGEKPEEVPFAIPEKWKWVYLDGACRYIQRGKAPKYSDVQEIPVIAQKCNQWDGFHIEKAKFISPESIDSYKEERLLQDGDVLWNSTGLGTLGRLAIYETKLNPYGIAVADGHVTVIRVDETLLDFRYLYFYLRNPSVQSVIEEFADGSTKQKELSTKTIKGYPIPLPPLAEQRRIVARLNQLLPQIERLRKN